MAEEETKPAAEPAAKRKARKAPPVTTQEPTPAEIEAAEIAAAEIEAERLVMVSLSEVDNYERANDGYRPIATAEEE